MNGPGTLPCSCLHEWGEHNSEGHCDRCECTEYRPIPRSEARRREFEQGRTEMAATADAANKSELKSQSFSTSTEPGHRFWVDQAHGLDRIISDVTPFGVAVGDHPVVDNGPLDTPPSARYMTYKTRTGAENGLGRARLELEDARIVEEANMETETVRMHRVRREPMTRWGQWQTGPLPDRKTFDEIDIAWALISPEPRDSTGNAPSPGDQLIGLLESLGTDRVVATIGAEPDKWAVSIVDRDVPNRKITDGEGDTVVEAIQSALKEAGVE